MPGHPIPLPKKTMLLLLLLLEREREGHAGKVKDSHPHCMRKVQTESLHWGALSWVEVAQHSWMRLEWRKQRLHRFHPERSDQAEDLTPRVGVTCKKMGNTSQKG